MALSSSFDSVLVRAKGVSLQPTCVRMCRAAWAHWSAKRHALLQQVAPPSELADGMPLHLMKHRRDKHISACGESDSYTITYIRSMLQGISFMLRCFQQALARLC